MQGGDARARCGGSTDAACCCVTDALLRFWAGSSYVGRGMASLSNSGTIGQANMASTLHLWLSRVPGLREDHTASIPGFGLSGGFRSFRFRQQ